MKPKTFLTTLTLSATSLFLALGVAACTNSAGSGQMTQEKQSPSQNMAQSPGMSMPGMSPSSGMPMQGMEQGAMNMDLGPKDETFDLRFIDGMMPHHQGAIAMAQEALAKSNRPEIKQLAQDIINAQQQEISQMQGWRQAWYPNASEEPVMYDAQMHMDMPMTEQMRSSMMMAGDLGAADDQFDLRFINAMTPHHQAAVEMAQQALKDSDRPEIRQLAQNIIDSQQQEIDQMKQWKQQWYGQ